LPSASQRRYINKLVAERLRQVAEDTYQNDAMLRGHEIEPEARSAYSLITGNDVQEVGLIYRDERRQVSASPDGLVGDIGGLEIKSPSPTIQVEYLDDWKVPTKYKPQVYGSLYISGAAWWDFFSYHPDMEPVLVRTTSDDPGYLKYKAALDEHLPKFLAAIDAVEERVRLRAA